MDKSTVSIITSIIALLAAAGIPTGQMLLSHPATIAELSHYYVCPLINDTVSGHLEIYFFDRIATSGQRGYPTAGTIKGYVDCKNDAGTRANWIGLITYAESLGIDPNVLLEDYLQTTTTSIGPTVPTTILSTTTTINGNGVPEPHIGLKCWHCGAHCWRCA